MHKICLIQFTITVAATKFRNNGNSGIRVKPQLESIPGQQQVVKPQLAAKPKLGRQQPIELDDRGTIKTPQKKGKKY